MPSVRFLRDGEQRRATSGGGELGRPYPRYVTTYFYRILSQYGDILTELYRF